MNPLLLGPVFDIIKQALSGLGLDPEAKARAQQQAFEVLTNGTFDQKSDQALALAQIDVNKADAAGSAMQRNWRPAVGWICGMALAWDNVVKPMVIFGIAASGHQVPPLPNLSTDQLYGVLFGLLGLGGMRTVEKIRGAA